MKQKNIILERATQTFLLQSKAVANLSNLIDQQFAEAVSSISSSLGRVIISGIGKSAIIANKLVATLNSTGTPSIFMHAADAIHGDLGVVQPNDILICISKSGNTPEIKAIIPPIKSRKNKIIAITGNPGSYLGKQADFVLNTFVEKEACPNNLAPTTSTTAQLVMGDALAICLLELNNFSSSDFAKHHPGGSLGKQLYLKASDLISSTNPPEVAPKSSIKDAIIEISKKRLGVTAVIENNTILGIITDGDLRRMLETNASINELTADAIMTQNPKTVTTDTLAVAILKIMKTNDITQVLVQEDGIYKGVIHLHDLLKEGII